MGSSSRVLVVAWKSLGQLAHDRRTIAFVLVVPLVLILIFGYGFGGQPTHVPTAVVNGDSGPLGARVLGMLPAGILDLRSVSDPASAYSAVQGGDDAAAIVIGVNFSQDAASGNATITVYVDGSSPTVVGAVLDALQTAIQHAFAGGGNRVPVVVAPSYVSGSPNQSFIDTLAPGVMAFVAVFATTVLSILVLVRERTQGILERISSTPLRAGEFVAGHALSLALVAMGQSVVLIVASLVIFQATFVGNLLLAFGVLTLFAVGNVGLGMLISAVSRSEFQAVQLIPFIVFPQLFFSGAVFPLDSIPVNVRPISEVLPLTYASDALRSVLLRGWGVGSIGWDLLILAMYATLTLIGATVLVRRQS
ncbi:MAG: ABC transporter permease [Thermoplasmata archaeon]